MTKILVYDVAASQSGALGVLEDYYAEACENTDTEYVFVVSLPELMNKENVRIRRYPKVKKSWLHRLWFDLVEAPSIVKEENPDYILSLQNTIVPRVKVPQIVYEHNCLFKPFTDYRFSLMKETNLWMRQNLVGPIVVRSLRRADFVIVQTEWMKRLCIDNLGLEACRIEVRPPTTKTEVVKTWELKLPVTFFYPANAVRFKNHEIIFDALEILKGIDVQFKVILTLRGDEDSRIASLKARADARNLPVEFVGWMDRTEVMKTYAESTLLFTSYLESSPLPLKEAIIVGCPVIAPECEYARESLKDYDYVFYYKQGDAESLANSIITSIASVLD